MFGYILSLQLTQLMESCIHGFLYILANRSRGKSYDDPHVSKSSFAMPPIKKKNPDVPVLLRGKLGIKPLQMPQIQSLLYTQAEV